MVNTKGLFLSLLRTFKCDVVLDIGSRDGQQSKAFRSILPSAEITAFEANPYNYARMKNDSTLASDRIHVRNEAISDAVGSVDFLISDVNYDAPDSVNNNIGTSSLLKHPEVNIQARIQVHSLRIDSFISENYPTATCLGLWLDVEGAEHMVLSGMKGVCDKTAILHVETARVPLREGQKTKDEVDKLMLSMGFEHLADNITPSAVWGDAVYISTLSRKNHLVAVQLALLKAIVLYKLDADNVANRLRHSHPTIYKWLRRTLLRIV